MTVDPAQAGDGARLGIVEGRVLGCLLEKERTVPDQYPLTMNALLVACNQATSREPMMHLDEQAALGAISTMKSTGWARIVHPSHGRSVTRYRHVADERLQLVDGASAMLALLSVLLLRGPQTVSELRTRTERLHAFHRFDDVESTLHAMAALGHVRLLERQPGHKEPRWQQLLADEAEPIGASSVRPDSGTAPARSVVTSAADTGLMAAHDASHAELVERIGQLEARIAKLETALADLL